LLEGHSFLFLRNGGDPSQKVSANSTSGKSKRCLKEYQKVGLVFITTINLLQIENKVWQNTLPCIPDGLQ